MLLLSALSLAGQLRLQVTAAVAVRGSTFEPAIDDGSAMNGYRSRQWEYRLR